MGACPSTLCEWATLSSLSTSQAACTRYPCLIKVPTPHAHLSHLSHLVPRVASPLTSAPPELPHAPPPRLFDSVSLFSLAQRAEQTPMLRLATAKRALTLTPDHRLPVGPTCCSNVVQAKDVQVGDAVWLAGSEGQWARRSEVVSIASVLAAGLYNPVLSGGGLPIIDGTVTAPNTASRMRLNSHVVPLLEKACAAMGTCDALLHGVSRLDCALRRLGGAECKDFHYIGGTSVIAEKGIPLLQLLPPLGALVPLMLLGTRSARGASPCAPL